MEKILMMVEVSRELTHRTVTANLVMREIGFKPYVAPALSSGALSILLTLRGAWHCGSVFLDGVFMGVKNRYTPAGVDRAAAPYPGPPVRPYPGGGGAFKVGIIEGKPVRTRFVVPLHPNGITCPA